MEMIYLCVAFYSTANRPRFCGSILPGPTVVRFARFYGGNGGATYCTFLGCIFIVLCVRVLRRALTL